MNGVNEINNIYIKRTLNVIKENPELTGFYSYLTSSGKSVLTINHYVYSALRLLKISGKSPNELVLDDFTKFMHVATYKEDGSQYTAGYTIEQYHGIKNYGDYLKATHVISENPMDYVKRPRDIESQETIQKREKGYLTSDEIKQVIKNIEKQSEYNFRKLEKPKSKFKYRDLAIITIFLTTGMRCSALTKMDIENINIKEHTIYLTEKGRKVRKYQLSDNVYDILFNWLLERNLFLHNKDIEENAVFISKYGERLKYDGIKEIVKKYTFNINGKHITPHKLRATYGTQLYEATRDIYFVQKAMGHSSPATTERYVRGQNDVTKEASDIMGNLF